MGIYYIDRENEGQSPLRSQMRNNMREKMGGSPGANTSEAFRQGYKQGYKDEVSPEGISSSVVVTGSWITSASFTSQGEDGERNGRISSLPCC